MSLQEMWLLFGIGGVLLFMQGSFARIIKIIAKKSFNKDIPDDYTMACVGFVIWILALISIITIPKTP